MYVHNLVKSCLSRHLRQAIALRTRHTKIQHYFQHKYVNYSLHVYVLLKLQIRLWMLYIQMTIFFFKSTQYFFNKSTTFQSRYLATKSLRKNVKNLHKNNVKLTFKCHAEFYCIYVANISTAFAGKKWNIGKIIDDPETECTTCKLRKHFKSKYL